MENAIRTLLVPCEIPCCPGIIAERASILRTEEAPAPLDLQYTGLGRQIIGLTKRSGTKWVLQRPDGRTPNEICVLQAKLK
jgi:hypothetical protein